MGCKSKGAPTAATPAPSATAVPSVAALATASASARPSLAEARRGFETKLVRRVRDGEPVDAPPPQLFRTVHYDSPAGKLAAYVGVSPKDGKKHPAILWVVGGFSNSIGDAWTDQPAENDQSAAAYRKAGIITMYPSFRGGNDNPGFKEGFFGEVDDLLAAASFLATQDYVDPQRIYLGGHSTGGTLVLLAAASSDRFRAVFSFGPVDEVAVYGAKNLPFDASGPRELELRAPGRWLHAVRNPTFVFEGTAAPSNLEALKTLAGKSTNPVVRFHPVPGASHFSVLGPTNAIIARKIVGDTGETTNIAFTHEDLKQPGVSAGLPRIVP
jgi:hypothetical protein